MSDPYVTAVMNLGGIAHWVRFQDFSTLLVRRCWKDKTIEPSQSFEGKSDILIFDSNDSNRLIAEVECKASIGNKIVRKNQLDNLVKPKEIREHRESLEEKGHRNFKSYIFTTRQVDKDIWNECKKNLGSNYEMWDADVLAEKLHYDPILATYLGGLPTSSPLFQEHALDLLVEKRPHYQYAVPPSPSLPIEQVIINEPLEDELLDFGNPILLYGPPNVGKTCWTIRQAWHWTKDKGPYATAFLLNASRDKPEYLIELVNNFPSEAEVLFIVDDIHFAYNDLEAWVASLNHAKKGREYRTHVIWIARDPSITFEFGATNIPIPLPFSVERVLRLYTKQLTGYLPWQRVIAVFETGLDPRLARQIQKLPHPATQALLDNSFVDFTEWLQKEVGKSVRSRLTDLEEYLKKAAYNAYLTLLPFGSISYPLETNFFEHIGITSDIDIEAIIKTGLGTRSREDRIALTEHPFQIKQALRALKGMLANSFARSLLRERFPECPDTTLPETIFALYLSKKDPLLEPSKIIKDLGNYAEWAGIAEPFAKALKFLLSREDWTDKTVVREDATVWCRKLTRKSYPDDADEERQLRQALEEDYTELEKECKRAEKAKNHKSGDNRLDYILYEIAFLDYLCGSYAKAEATFSNSVRAGLDAVEQGMLAESGTTEWIDGANALANVWISGILEHCAAIRHLLYQAIRGQHSNNFERKMEQHIAELASIHQKVAEANRAQQENSGHLYLRALQVMCPSWHPPARKAPIPRTSQIQGMERALARHERNAWLHALETSCLPMLYGLCHKRIPATILPPNGDYRPALSLPAPTVGLPLSRQRQVEALYNWTEKPMTGQGLEDEALCAAALTRASGNLEGLSDAVLLAWRCASEEKANALEWYLQHRVPKLGHNELSRAALHYLSDTGHRVQTASSD